MSAWADVFDSLRIPVVPNTKSPAGTFSRLEAWLQHRLSEDQARFARCQDAVSVLRRINDVRNAEQHGDAGRKMPGALKSLGIEYPPLWPQAWDGIRFRTVEALAILRDEIRLVAP